MSVSFASTDACSDMNIGLWGLYGPCHISLPQVNLISRDVRQSLLPFIVFYCLLLVVYVLKKLQFWISCLCLENCSFVWKQKFAKHLNKSCSLNWSLINNCVTALALGFRWNWTEVCIMIAQTISSQFTCLWMIS